MYALIAHSMLYCCHVVTSSFVTCGAALHELIGHSMLYCCHGLTSGFVTCSAALHALIAHSVLYCCHVVTNSCIRYEPVCYSSILLIDFMSVVQHCMH